MLDPAVQGPAQRAALAAAEGGVPGGQRVQEGTPIRVHLTDGGYVGSGDLRDMNNFRPISLFFLRWEPLARNRPAHSSA